jgi:hypothetical protein
MKKSLILIAGILIINSFASSKKANDPAIGDGKLEYAGTAQMTIRYYDYDPFSGQDYFVEEKNYTYDVFVCIDPPKHTGNIYESNPFYLQISPDRNGQDEEGNIDIVSSTILVVSTGEVLLQYWEYTLAGNQLNGTLTENHLTEAAAGNLIWAWDDVAGLIMTIRSRRACSTSGDHRA